MLIVAFVCLMLTERRTNFYFRLWPRPRRRSRDLALRLRRGGVADRRCALTTPTGRLILAGAYFSATDAIGSSPADPPTAILAEPRGARAAADRLLLRAGVLSVTVASAPVAPAARRPCFTAARTGTRPLDSRLPSGGNSISAAPGGTAVIRARRFAAAFPTLPLATAPRDRQIIVRAAPDRSSLPWELQTLDGAGADLRFLVVASRCYRLAREHDVRDS